MTANEIIEKAKAISDKPYPLIGVYGISEELKKELDRLRYKGYIITILDKHSVVSASDAFAVTSNVAGFIDRMDVIIDYVGDGTFQSVESKIIRK